jgi:hypothetical protein
VAAPAPAAPTAPPPPTGDPLIDKLNVKKTEVAADWTATSSPMKQALEATKAQQYSVQLPGPPYCHTFIAAGGDGVTNLDLNLVSPAGTPAASETEVDSTALIQNHCPTMPGSYTFTVAMTGGKGEFAVQVFSK